MVPLLLMIPVLALGALSAAAQPPDLILHHGKIVTVDPQFRIAEAMAVKGDRILAVGPNDEILKLAGPKTEQTALEGRMVLPGLIDSHAHPPNAATYEFDHPIPQMETVADILEYIKSRAKVLKPGEWIGIQQVFITRLREPRFPTRQELDEAAPNNPVFFRTGPDAALNSLAMKLSGIDRDFIVPEGHPGYIERDSATSEPTGVLRNCSQYVKYKSSGKTPTDADRYDCLKALLAAYNEAGITGVTDRGASDQSIATYSRLKDKGELTCRVFLTYYVNAEAPFEKIEAGILKAARHPLHKYDNMLWLRGLKVYLDGGMLTGSAYMREPWGVSKIYAITDPTYRGLLFIQPDRLQKIARLALENDLQPTAHTVGDGAVHALIDAYETVNRDLPVRERRPCICHSNFISAEAIEKMRALGIVADLQPAWLYLDGAVLTRQFGEKRLEYFQPYRTLFDRGVIVGGGSDHMQKLGSLRSINPYNPFLGMWTVIARQPRWTDKPLHTEQRITRQEAIRLYTINCAYLTFEEREKGSLEAGKLADFIILDRDILACPEDEVKDIQVRETWLGGKRIYQRH
ncbi:MAG: amidohydrolase [Candidatus Sumerlaeota bacterium]|nr:amidohydrolase [Candidatus Sumerlaeota bacterium]